MSAPSLTLSLLSLACALGVLVYHIWSRPPVPRFRGKRVRFTHWWSRRDW
jgi:hypothetical protein